MKLSDLNNTYTIVKGFSKDRIFLIKDGFKTTSNSEPRYLKQTIDKIDGFVGEIQLDHDSDDDYSIVTNIHVVEDMRRKGYATMLYNEALKLSKKLGKKGIASPEFMRTGDGSKEFWKNYGQGYDEDKDFNVITKAI